MSTLPNDELPGVSYAFQIMPKTQTPFIQEHISDSPIPLLANKDTGVIYAHCNTPFMLLFSPASDSDSSPSSTVTLQVRIMRYENYCIHHNSFLRCSQNIELRCSNDSFSRSSELVSNVYTKLLCQCRPPSSSLFSPSHV